MNRVSGVTGLILLFAVLLQGVVVVESLSKLAITITRRDAVMSGLGGAFAAAATVAVAPPGSGVANAAYIDPNLVKITDRVYIDVEFIVDGKITTNGRIVMGLFGESMPRVTQNFVTLCKDNKYAGTSFYRVISDITVQGGAIGDDSGKTGQSSFVDNNGNFEPDNFDIKHSKEGLVSMVRNLDGSVDSRFFINTAEDAGWADDRYAAFGIVEEGMNLVHKMEKVKVKGSANRPIQPIAIVASGVL